MAAKKLKNKQAEMLEKLKKARQQKDGGGESSNDDANATADGSTSRLSKEEIKEQNDRKRFQELLEKSSSMILNDYSADGYLNKRQEEEEISAQMSGVERIFEGDPAPIRCFEGLVTIQTETPIGKKGAERLIPWFPANADKSNYLICISDPRPTSHDLKETVKNLMTELPLDIRSRIIVINADSPAENRRWLKRNPILEEQNLQVYSDEKKEWMQAYTALDKKRWSMTMFLIADERVQALARDLDMHAASRVVQNAVKKLQEARL
jgi:hypothetical protein